MPAITRRNIHRLLTDPVAADRIDEILSKYETEARTAVADLRAVAAGMGDADPNKIIALAAAATIAAKARNSAHTSLVDVSC